MLNAPVIVNYSDGQKKLLGNTEEEKEKLYGEQVPKLSQEQKNSEESDLSDDNYSIENKNGYQYKSGGEKTRVLYEEVIIGITVCFVVALIAIIRNDEEYIGDYSLYEIFEFGVVSKKQEKEQQIDVYFDQNYQSET